MGGETEARGVEGARGVAEGEVEVADREYGQWYVVRMKGFEEEVVRETERISFAVDILEFEATPSAVAPEQR